MTNPYQAPTTAYPSGADQVRVWIALVPFFVAAAAFVAALGIWISRPIGSGISGAAIGVVAVLMLSLIICAYVLVYWLRTGLPPDLLAEFMEMTPEQREFHRQLRARRKLHDDAFYETYYANSGVPKHVVAQLHSILEELTGYDLSGLQPADNLGYLDDNLDFADVLRRVERDLGVKLDWDEFRHIAVTFDVFVRVVARRLEATSATHAQARAPNA